MDRDWLGHIIYKQQGFWLKAQSKTKPQNKEKATKQAGAKSLGLSVQENCYSLSAKEKTSWLKMEEENEQQNTQVTFN